MKNERIMPEALKKLNVLGFFNEKQPAIYEKIKTFDPRTYQVITAKDFTPITFPFELGSCYLFGDVGSGKTVELCCRILEWAKRKYINGKPQIDFELVTCEQLLQEIRNSYNQGSAITEQEIVDKYQKVSLLAIDEFGVFSASDWAFRIVYMIINYQYSHFKPTMYTSNYSLGNLSELLEDERIPSRIEHDCTDSIIHFNGKSRRV